MPLIDSDRVRDVFRLRLLVHHLLSDDDIRWLARFKDCNRSNEPGSGKSLVACDVAARITVGGDWPDGGVAECGTVLFVAPADDVSRFR